jgi:hypothetical protein
MIILKKIMTTSTTTYDRIKVICKKINKIQISSEKNNVIKLINENYLFSMQFITNYTLFDQLGVIHDERECMFENLDEIEIYKIYSYAKQIDYLSNELVEINDRINQINKSYKLYYKSFLKLCDDKDILVGLFFEYYQQYILNNKNDESESEDENYKKKKSKRKIYVYNVPVYNRFSVLSNI